MDGEQSAPQQTCSRICNAEWQRNKKAKEAASKRKGAHAVSKNDPGKISAKP
jgi:hypothetical protein